MFRVATKYAQFGYISYPFPAKPGNAVIASEPERTMGRRLSCRASEQAIRLLIAAQQECEELYLSSTHSPGEEDETSLPDG